MAEAPTPWFTCPVPITTSERVLLAHGGGGRMTQQLLRDLIQPAFQHPSIVSGQDGAQLPFPGGRIAMSTDSFVVHPLFFPGGDIGSLAVTGTVNDLAMCGARPLYLTLGLILEEGLPIDVLRLILESLRAAAEEAGVTVVTGDTKVVERGKADGIFINTAGVGVVEHERPLGPAEVRPGDKVVVSGDIGRHGVAILSLREGLSFEVSTPSDCAQVHRTVARIFEAGVEAHCLRDPTRGGTAAALYEIARTAGLSIAVDEARVPVHPGVDAACEMLGLDPLHVACEGRMLAIVPESDVDRTLDAMRDGPGGDQAAVIGEVLELRRGAPLLVRSLLGSERIVTLPSGSQLPRIC